VWRRRPTVTGGEEVKITVTDADGNETTDIKSL